MQESNPNSPAEELRAAATLIRETASEAITDRWDALFPDSRAPHIKPLNAWIRLLSPALAEHLFAWLYDAANDMAGAEVVGSKLPDAADPIEYCDEPDSVRHALTFARTILGRASDGSEAGR